VLVSPPIDESDAELRSLMGTKGLLVCGDQDPFCPVGDLQRTAESIGWDWVAVPGADHFYLGRELPLMEAVDKGFPP